MAQDEGRHHSLVPGLCGLPEGKVSQAASGLSTANPHSSEEVLPRPRGHGWFSPGLRGRVPLNLHHHQQNYQVAGGCAAERHVHGLLCGGLPRLLGGPVWRSGDHHLRPRFSVHCCVLGLLLYTAGHAPCHDNGLPSSGQWPRRKGP
jgi:hypothetical protein